MNARNSTRNVAVIVLIVGVLPAVVFSAPVYIYGGDFALLIPSADDSDSEYGRGWMSDAIIDVPDHFSVTDLDVRISLTHEALFDLQILLQSPAGTNVLLNPAGNLAFIVRGQDGRLTAYGGSVDWVFDQEADISIEEAKEPFIGAFRPVWDLSLFDNEDACGTWRLQIRDAYYGDSGTLDSFELVITAPEPATATVMILGLGLLMSRRYSRKL